MIKIIDYGLGNLNAFLNGYKRQNIQASLAKTSADVLEASKVILPGVGAFDHAMDLLNRSGMREALDEVVTRKHVPVLGICVGMQILGASSDEGTAAGLGWVPGHVRHFKALKMENQIFPHMGWNTVDPAEGSKLFDKLSDARFYFLHSYYFDCERSYDVAAVSNYGADFACAVQSGNVYGVQFHPEKSHHFGMQLLKNFAELPC
jgi:glutamine amidotransferase